MKHRWIIAGAVLGAGTFSAFANTTGNPYRVITVKNAFRLVEPRKIEVPTSVPAEPPVNLRFTGLSWDGDTVSAWLVINPVTPAATPTYLTLAPGQQAENLHLLEINERSEEITIRYQDKDRILSMERSGKTLATAPGTPLAMTRTAPQPAVVPGLNTALANPGSIVVRPTSATGTGVLANPVGPGSTSFQGQPITPEESVIRMEVLRELTKDRVGRGEHPPLPPTLLTPAGSP
jgi:hypothetical protein